MFPILTVYCLAYNHEKFIRYALDGFVNQKTNYCFKVIVHDDASTDQTPNIIREYADKYPNIIFPIFQKENQYSKGVDIFDEYIVPLIEGKYIAVCEGDDYWSDNSKIQSQLEYLESHPECSLCVHNTECISADGKNLNILFNNSFNDQDYDSKTIIEGCGGGLFHTSSFMYRKECRIGWSSAFKINGIGDYPLTIHASLLGKVHYLGTVMSRYRVGVPGSWSVRNNVPRIQKHNIDNMLHALDAMNEYTHHQYDYSFEYAKKAYMFSAMNNAERIKKSIVDSDVRRILLRVSKRKFMNFFKIRKKR